ncbi:MULTISPECIES: dihydroorotase [Variovorax]|jgi:dihydroorotase|uniref:Dihydroorotase n=1 Tax=Variovorax paradoxus TaxID=34073 RepID=A0AA91IA95_VARPD|nr:MULTISPECIES: dihydroorotase [Variovorax]AVQ83614.1 dihydroorotase [Variovorax sp. PMC12]OAK62198.1 dihydroorotase [Variovorax paradoxus]QRY32065.1 dihydroorotase [Variovorax sp. PDNC026]
MNILITNGRVVDPASRTDKKADIAIADGKIAGIGAGVPAGFKADRTIDAAGCIVAPGLVDLAARLREPGYEHEGMLESEMAAAIAGGVTSLVCPPDTDPVLDEPGLVEMLKFRAEKLQGARLFPLGALTRNLAGGVLTEMAELTEAGCIGFGQADVPLADTQVLQRALSYASTFGYTVWLRPQDRDLGKGVAASGPLATRLGLGGVPVSAETIAIFTIVELMKATGARVHLCRISSARGVALVREAKAQGLPLTCDVSINSLHLADTDIGYFDSRARLNPPLRQQGDRDALSAALADGTIDALVSDHTPVEADAKTLPFAEAEAGATGLELLLPLALLWSERSGAGIARAIEVVTSAPARLLAAADADTGIGRIVEGGVADLCIVDPALEWQVRPDALKSQGKHTPFSGYPMQGRARHTLVAGRVVHG